MTLSDLLTDADLEEIERRDAAYWTSASAEDDTGRQRAHDRRVLLAALRSERAARGRVKALAVEWDRVAGRTGERMFQGDPSATLARMQTLETCASALRAALTTPSTTTPEAPE